MLIAATRSVSVDVPGTFSDLVKPSHEQPHSTELDARALASDTADRQTDRQQMRRQIYAGSQPSSRSWHRLAAAVALPSPLLLDVLP